MILAIFCKTVQRKFAHQEHHVIIIDLTPILVITTATGIGHTPAITDAAKGTALTGLNCSTAPCTTKAPVITRGMHPFNILP